MNVYADNAATTAMSRTAIEAMLPFLDWDYGNPSSPHRMGRRAAAALQQARERVARCLGAQPGEIYFCSGGSEADNWALLSAAEAGAQAGKRHILSTAIEHPAVLRPLEALRERGFEIELLPVNGDGSARGADRPAFRPARQPAQRQPDGPIGRKREFLLRRGGRREPSHCAR